MIYVILCLSLFLEGIFSNIVPFQNSFFVPLFAMMTIVLLYPYGKIHLKKYILTIFIYGVVYDFIYTQALFLDGILFVGIIMMIHFLYRFFSSSVVGLLFLECISIFIYRVGSYIILCMIGYVDFKVNILVSSIYFSILLNVLYASLFYYIIKWCNKKHTLLF